MLADHLNEKENELLAKYSTVSGAGHALHKGTPREVFVREFLSDHLSERIAVGTGEIIDCDSKPGQSRPQNDVVLFYRGYPRLKFGGDIHAFLAESVVATIEVKSKLTKDELRKSIKAAAKLKRLSWSARVGTMIMGTAPPSILTYVVAYQGPERMDTVHSWIAPLHQELGLPYPPLREGKKRYDDAAPSIDGVFVLGKGLALFNNTPFGFIRAEQFGPETRWTVCDVNRGSLAILFFYLLSATASTMHTGFSPLKYTAGWQLPDNIHLGA